MSRLREQKDSELNVECRNSIYECSVKDRVGSLVIKYLTTENIKKNERIKKSTRPTLSANVNIIASSWLTLTLLGAVECPSVEIWKALSNAISVGSGVVSSSSFDSAMRCGGPWDE